MFFTRGKTQHVHSNTDRTETGQVPNVSQLGPCPNSDRQTEEEMEKRGISPISDIIVQKAQNFNSEPSSVCSVKLQHQVWGTKHIISVTCLTEHETCVMTARESKCTVTVYRQTPARWLKLAKYMTSYWAGLKMQLGSPSQCKKTDSTTVKAQVCRQFTPLASSLVEAVIKKCCLTSIPAIKVTIKVQKYNCFYLVKLVQKHLIQFSLILFI